MHRCQLCGRLAATTRHHLIPRKLHRRFKRRGRVDPERLHHTVNLCVPCHDTVHRTHDEKELAERYDTLDKLAQSPPIKRFRKWIASKPAGFSPVVKTPAGRR